MTTTNEMIFRTLKTKADKRARYADELRELGYTVENTMTLTTGTYDREYWSVNGLELYRPDAGPVSLDIRSRCIERLDAIGRIDFENYFATYDERRAKEKRMASHGAIEQRHQYRKGERSVYIDPDGREHRDWESGRRWARRTVRIHTYTDLNHTVEEYKRLKRKADASSPWNYNEEADYNIRYAERRVADAEARVEKLRRQLEEAEKCVERCKEDVQREIEKKAEGRRELDSWLAERGIRKEVA